MNKSNHDSAILIFSKSIEEEQKELVSHNQRNNRSSLTWLRNRTIQLVESTQLPYFLIERQTGNTFGERLTDAVQQVFEKGYKNVIVIGNDCVELTKSDLNEAIHQLNDGNSVLGPDQRQGSYLIAFNRNQFDADTLALLPWQTKFTFSALANYLKSPTILEPRADLNNSQDLARLQKNTNRGLRKFVRRLFKEVKSYIEYQLTMPNTKLVLAFTHRGPPMR